MEHMPRPDWEAEVTLCDRYLQLDGRNCESAPPSGPPTKLPQKVSKVLHITAQVIRGREGIYKLSMYALHVYGRCSASLAAVLSDVSSLPIVQFMGGSAGCSLYISVYRRAPSCAHRCLACWMTRSVDPECCLWEECLGRS